MEIQFTFWLFALFSMAMQFGRGGMSRAAAVAMGGLAVLCCLLLLAISSSDTQTPTALMHVGALAQAQTVSRPSCTELRMTDNQQGLVVSTGSSRLPLY